jgi:DNA polymerase-3 subunit delta
MSKPAPRAYIFHGEDDLGREEAVQKLLNAMGSGPEAEMNISRFDETASVAAIINAVRSFPFLSTRRLVIVTGLLEHLGRKGGGEAAKKAQEHLISEIPHLPEYSRLALVERVSLKPDHKVVQAVISSGGFVRAYPLPEDATGWILKRASAVYHLEMDARAASALASVTGSDLRRADNELHKLWCYTEGARPVTEADVALLTPYVPEANIFEMVDALASQNGRLAMRLIHTALEQDPREDGFGLFGMIVRQFRALLLAREHLDRGGSRRDLPSLLKMHPYAAEKVEKQCRAFTLEELEAIYRRLQAYDEEMKTGRVAPVLALDLLVSALSRD